MKKRLIAGLLVFGILMAYFGVISQTTYAKDAWVESNNSGVETYVVEETIHPMTNTSSRSFTVSIKKVQNGKLRDSETIAYEQYHGDSWRVHYERGHAWTTVSYKDEVFEYCMKYLGWNYKLVNIGRTSNIYQYS